MATTLETFVPFDTLSLSQMQWEAMFSRGAGHLPGPLRGEDNRLVVTPYASSLGVLVDTGKLSVKGHHGENQTQKLLSIAAPAATEINSRIDQVVGYCEFGTHTMGLDVIKGTPSSVPVAPALEQSALRYECPLALVTVAPGASVLTPGNIVDARQWAVPAQDAGGMLFAGTVAADAAMDASGNEQIFPGWSFPVAIRAGRRLRLRLMFFVSAAQSNGPNLSTITLRFRDGGLTGTELFKLPAIPFTFATFGYINMDRIIDTLTQGLHTFVVTGQISAGGGAAWVLAGSTTAAAANSANPPPWFTVEDLGPVP